MAKEFQHIPVLLKETIDLLKPLPDKVYVDCTLGGGGHSEEILKRANGKCTLIGIDADMDAIEAARIKLDKFKSKTKLVQGNFADIKKIVNKEGFEQVNGILFDLGVSSFQIDSAEKGFSLRQDGPLDMRMDRSKSLTAEEIVNDYGEEELEKIFKTFGEERFSKRIAGAILKEREKTRITRTLQLVELIKKATPPAPPDKKLDSVTRIFQALRIAVNSELESLKTALKDSIDLLKKNGRIVVISYHSLEDRIVKTLFKEEGADCICPPKLPVCVCGHKKRIKILTKKPVVPGEKEIEENPRSRSAKFRAAQKL